MGNFVGRPVVPASQSEAPFWRVNWPGRQVFFSIYHISERTFRYYVDEIKGRKLSWIHGFPSTFSHLADLMEAHGVSFNGAVTHITLGAESVQSYQLKKIESAFGVRPKQHYCMSEAVANIAEWPDGSLRIDEDYAATELIEDESGRYEIVGTNFTNPAFPLIRYRVGDTVTPAGAPSQGDWGRVVPALDGRVEDFVILKDGTYLGRLDRIFDDLPVKEAQLVQRRIGELEVHLVPGPNYSEATLAALDQEIQKRIGIGRISYNVFVTDAIAPTSLGKKRFVVSHLGQDKP